MKVAEAIAYLQNKTIPTKDRFKVVSGYDTEAQAKHPTDRSNWASALGDANLLSSLVVHEATSSFGGFFSTLGNMATGKDLQTTLKTAYKKAIGSKSDADQEAYIQLVIDLMVKHQTTDELSKFEFADPSTILTLRTDLASSPS